MKRSGTKGIVLYCYIDTSNSGIEIKTIFSPRRMQGGKTLKWENVVCWPNFFLKWEKILQNLLVELVNIEHQSLFQRERKGEITELCLSLVCRLSF